jgi:hypothetical protein
MLRVLPGTPRLTSQLKQTTVELGVGGVKGVFHIEFTPPTAQEFFPFLKLYMVLARYWPEGPTLFYKMENDFSDILKLISSPSLIELKYILQDVPEVISGQGNTSPSPETFVCT